MSIIRPVSASAGFEGRQDCLAKRFTIQPERRPEHGYFCK